MNMIKTIGISVLLLLIIIGGYASYRAIDSYFSRYSQEELDRRTLQIAEGVVSKQIEISNAVFREEMKEISKAIRDSFKERNQEITDIGNTVVKLNQTVKTLQESDHTYKKDSESDHEFIIIRNKDATGKEFPIAWAMYQPNKPDTERWKTGTYPFEIKSKIILGESKKRSDSVVEVWGENNQMAETKGVKFPLDVDVNWVQKEQEKKFRFNPRLSLGVAANTHGFYPSLDMSFFSYGVSNVDMDWRFIEIGVGGSDSLYFSGSLISYNIGKPLPLIENLFLEPFIDTDLLFYDYGLKLSVPF